MVVNANLGQLLREDDICAVAVLTRLQGMKLSELTVVVTND